MIENLELRVGAGKAVSQGVSKEIEQTKGNGENSRRETNRVICLSANDVERYDNQKNYDLKCRYHKPLPKGQMPDILTTGTINYVNNRKLFTCLKYSLLQANLVQNCNYIVFLIDNILLRNPGKFNVYSCFIYSIKNENEYNRFIQFKFNQLSRIFLKLPFDIMINVFGKLIFNYMKLFKNLPFPNKTIENLITKYNFLDKSDLMASGIVNPNLFIYLFHTIIPNLNSNYANKKLILSLLIWLDDSGLLKLYQCNQID